MTSFTHSTCVFFDFAGFFYPHAFLKSDGDIAIASVRPSVCPSVTLSPPKPLDEIQPNLVCELLTCMGRATAQLFWPRPLGPWGGAKRSNIIKFQLLRRFQIFFKPNFVCLLTNERYKTYQTGFSSICLGHAPGVELCDYRGVGVIFPPKFNQNFVCE